MVKKKYVNDVFNSIETELNIMFCDISDESLEQKN